MFFLYFLFYALLPKTSVAEALRDRQKIDLITINVKLTGRGVSWAWIDVKKK